MTQKIPEWINRKEFEVMLEAAKKERDKFWKPRLKTFTPRGERIDQYIVAMVLGFGAGLRISEITGSLKEQHYVYTKQTGEKVDRIIKTEIPRLSQKNFHDKFIKVLGKGKKERTTYLPTKLFVKAGITRQRLFKLIPIGQYDGQCYRGLERYVEKIGKKALKKKVNFHMFRHGFASELAGSGMPLHHVQAMTGHSRLDTLGIYTHANPTQVIKGAEEVFG